jgi:glycosyltransferase involved in cell wall biosynthesis
VVPALTGRPTGGTRYNAELIRELSARGVALSVVDLASAEAALATTAFDWVWVDSLYLGKFPTYVARAPRAARIGLILHYLPSLLERGESAREELLRIEQRALAESSVVLTTSAYMQALLIDRGLECPCWAVEPGVELVLGGSCSESGTARLQTQSDGGPIAAVAAICVAHVVPGKGVLELLQALARLLLPADRLRLCIVGDFNAGGDYAEACRELAARDSALRGRVEFLGTLPPPRVARELARANLFLSASRMESFGMALAEARVAGVPILACEAGNVAAHVSAKWGAELLASPSELARRAVELSRDPALHAERWRLACEHAAPPRPWSHVAEEFLRHAAALQAHAP